MKLVGYIRTSTDDKGQDPERQRPLVQGSADRGGDEIVAWVVDEGTSAGKRGPLTLDRPLFKEAIRLAVQHGADGILVENVDRMTRKGPMELGYTVFILERDYGLKMVFSDVPKDPFIQSVLVPLMAALALLDNERKSSSIRSGMALKKAGGAVYGQPPKPDLTDDEWHLVAEVLSRNRKNGFGVAAREVSRARGALDLVDPNDRRKRSVTRFWLEVQLAMDPDKSRRLISWSPPPSRLKLAARRRPGLQVVPESEGERAVEAPASAEAAP